MRRLFKSHSVIFKEGDKGDAAYLIRSGKVAIAKDTADGPVILATIGKRSIFGEMALIDGSPRMASAIAAENTICTVIDPGQIKGQLAVLTPSARDSFEAMIRYVRGTLPWEQRCRTSESAAESKDDLAMRRLLPSPDAPVPLDFLDPILRVLYVLLLDYVRRRLPQPTSSTGRG
ncbi:MAG: cyclic nucleotide-binding domain-containing protein [Proteobacteria bacterium]|nr:cyclic nucleotide-binding domain-containing protein [Pseudomonadota bacterium]MBI3498929.1 cyclic nucleotide-binding domain-containing protein [Pseudomonadota bacterium]